MINEQILAAFEEQRPALERLRVHLHAELVAALGARGVEVNFVTSRVKSLESLRRKIARPDKTYRRLWDVTDLVGLRVATYFEDAIEDVARLVEEIYQVDFVHSADKLRFTDYGKFGYRSLHYVCAPPSLGEPGTTGAASTGAASMGAASAGAASTGAVSATGLFDAACRFEIQVRTSLQHAWAEVEHDLGYKADGSVPEVIRRRLSRIASLLELADQEFVSIRHDLGRYQQAVREALEHPERPIPLDAVALSALAQSPDVRALDEALARALRRPLGAEVYSPDYLVKLLHLAGLGTTKELQEALTRHGEHALSVVEPYFQFTERTWQLTAKSLDVVNRCYSLFFLAHVAVLRGPELGINKVTKLQQLYLSLDYPGDERTAQQVASGLVAALTPALPL
jgi:putative GTP pyrophosphokinase